MDEKLLGAFVTDGHGFILCLREEEKKGNYCQTTKSNDLACCFGAKYHDKVWFFMVVYLLCR
jgi:hypothetical protein